MRTREIKKGARVEVIKKYGITNYVGKKGNIIKNLGLIKVKMDNNQIYYFDKSRLKLIKPFKEAFGLKFYIVETVLFKPKQKSFQMPYIWFILAEVSILIGLLILLMQWKS